jgi:hypothetical protein
MTKVLWGYKVGDKPYNERPLIETDDPKLLQTAKQWASDNSYIGLRVQLLDMRTPPNFAATVRV